MKKNFKIVLFILIGLVIFPAAWGVKINPTLNSWFNTVFAAEWAHILAHFILFLILGFLCQYVLFNEMPFVRAWILTVVFVAAVGTFQEIFQLLVKQRGFQFPEVFDLLVDISSSTLGLLLYRFVARWRKK